MKPRSALSTVRKGTYRHNKTGKLYEVIGLAVQTETDERLVIYRPMYEHDFEYEFFTRPYDMFIEDVELDGRNVARFEKVDS